MPLCCYPLPRCHCAPTRGIFGFFSLRFFTNFLRLLLLLLLPGLLRTCYFRLTTHLQHCQLPALLLFFASSPARLSASIMAAWSSSCALELKSASKHGNSVDGLTNLLLTYVLAYLLARSLAYGRWGEGGGPECICLANSRSTSSSRCDVFIVLSNR